MENRSRTKVRKASIFCVVALFFLLTVLPILNAEETPENLIDATFDIQFITPTDFILTVTLDIQKITVFDTAYATATIQTISTSDPETMGAIKLRLRDLVKTQIENVFDNAYVFSRIGKPTYANNQFTDEFGVNLTSEYFGLTQEVTIEEFIPGVLDLDAIVLYHFNFQAELGWDNTYTVQLPSTMFFKNTTGSVSGQTIQWNVENLDGVNSSKTGWLSVQYAQPTTKVSEKESISLLFTLDTTDEQHTQLQTSIQAKSINIHSYGIIPQFISNIDIIAADGIRLFVQNQFVSWNEIYNQTFQPIETTIISSLENSRFNQTLNMIYEWDDTTTQNTSQPYNIGQMNDDPAVTATLKDDDVSLFLLDLSTRACFGLSYAGGLINLTNDDVNFGDNLISIGYPYQCRLLLPSNITLNDQNTYVWNYSIPFTGFMKSDNAPKYTEEELRMRIDIEIKQMDLNLLSFFSGRTELTAATYTQSDLDYYVTRLPDEFTLPEQITLAYLNADAIRLCIEEGVFSEEEVGLFLENRKNDVEQIILGIFNETESTANIDRSAFTDSLTWNKDIANVDKNTPVTVSSFVNNLKPVAFSLGLLPPSFNISEQHFEFSGLENKKVVYRILFPRGITIDASDVLDKPIVTGETESGQQYIELSFDEGQSEIKDILSFKMTASPFYILGLFLPCLLSFILVIILVVLVLVLRKKRRGRGGFLKKSKPIKGSTESIESQEYYVPPPQ